MLKFLRKYNKYILAVFGTILMVAWLAPQGIQQLGGDPRKAVVYTINGVGYTALDEQRAAQELSAIERFYPMLPQFLGLEKNIGALHWLAMKHEVKAAGLMGGKGEGEEFVQQFGPALTQGQGTPDEQKQVLERVIGFALEAGQHMTRDDFHAALGAVRGALRLRTLYTELPRLSDRRSVGLALDRQSSAWVDFVTIPADRALAGIAEPDEPALAAFFAARRGSKQGEDELGLGYTLPPRAKIEYMRIDRAQIEAAIPVDPIAVNQAWRLGREKYTGEFEAERARVESDMKSARVSEVLVEIHAFVQASVMRSTRTLESDGRYKALPADWASQRPSWATIAAEAVKHIHDRLKLTIPQSVVVTLADQWLTGRDLSALPEIGQGATRQGSVRTPFPSLVLAARGSGQESGAPLPVQTGVPIAEAFVEDQARNRYYLTVLDVRGTSPPDSMDEIRPTLIKDFKRVRAYEALRAREDEFRTLAAGQGLEGVANLFKAVPEAGSGSDPLPLAIGTRGEVSRDGMRSPPLTGNATTLNDPGVRAAIMAAAAALDPTKPASEQPPAIAVASIPKRMEIVVAKVTAVTPFTRDDYRLLSPAWFASAGANEVNKALTPDAASMGMSMPSNPFGFESMRSRLDFRGPDGQPLKFGAKDRE
jgi:hypothetical protein